MKGMTIPWDLVQRRADLMTPMTHGTAIATARIERLTLGPVGNTDLMDIEAIGTAKAFVTMDVRLTATARPFMQQGRLRLTDVRLGTVSCSRNEVGVSMDTLTNAWLKPLADAACRRIEMIEYNLAEQPSLAARLAGKTIDSITCTQDGIAIGFRRPKVSGPIMAACVTLAAALAAIAVYAAN